MSDVMLCHCQAQALRYWQLSFPVRWNIDSWKTAAMLCGRPSSFREAHVKRYWHLLPTAPAEPLAHSQHQMPVIWIELLGSEFSRCSWTIYGIWHCKTQTQAFQSTDPLPLRWLIYEKINYCYCFKSSCSWDAASPHTGSEIQLNQLIKML